MQVRYTPNDLEIVLLSRIHIHVFVPPNAMIVLCGLKVGV